MLNLRIASFQPYSVVGKENGVENSFWMYATLALQVIAVDADSGAVYVEPHWVGVVDVWDEGGQEPGWILSGAMPFSSSELPSEPEKVVLMRSGLRPVFLNECHQVTSHLRPLWWQDWQERSGQQPVEKVPGRTRLMWDLGTDEDFAANTQAEAISPTGERLTLKFKWSGLPQMDFKIAFRARLDEGKDQSENKGAGWVEERVPIAKWNDSLARCLWLRSLEPLSISDENQLTPQLPHSARVRLSLPCGGEFVAARMAWELQKLLPHEPRPFDLEALKLLALSYEVGLGGRSLPSPERAVRAWPPAPPTQKPLRPISPIEPQVLERIRSIGSRLERLRELDSQFSIFGSTTHRYVLNPPLTEKQIQEFEDKNNISLPDEYRWFLLHLGNGGAGPGYGLPSLAQARKQSEGKLDLPFPFTEAFSPLLIEPFEETQITASEIASSRTPTFVFDAFAEFPVKNKNLNGALALGTYGCGIDVLLILTGPERNSIWIDDLCNDGPMSPFSSDTKSRWSFLDWYEAWLDECLAKLD